MKKATTYFFQGLLYIAPFSIILYVIYTVFRFVDSILKDILLKLLNVYIPGLGLLIIVALIILTGILGQTIIARPFKALFKQFIEKTPLLKVVYSAINDLFTAFVGKEKKFNRPVMVLINPDSKLEKLGFLTTDDLTKFGEKEKVAVYFPHSYNFSGELFIVPRENIRSVDLNPALVMKFIVSAGVSDWDESRN